MSLFGNLRRPTPGGGTMLGDALMTLGPALIAAGSGSRDPLRQLAPLGAQMVQNRRASALQQQQLQMQQAQWAKQNELERQKAAREQAKFDLEQKRQQQLMGMIGGGGANVFSGLTPSQREQASAYMLADKPEKAIALTGGPDLGSGNFGDLLSYVTSMKPRIDSGDASPLEESRYRGALAKLGQTRTIATPQGPIVQPGISATQIFGVAPGPMPQSTGAAIEGQAQVPSTPEQLAQAQGGMFIEKPKTAAEASAIASARSAMKDLRTARDIYFPGGNFDPEVSVVGKTGWPKSEGRRADQAMRRAVEVLLRARSGAAVPPEEIETYMTLYAPSPLDNDATAKAKMDTIQSLFEMQLQLQGQEIPKEEQLEPSGVPKGYKPTGRTANGRPVFMNEAGEMVVIDED